MGGEIERGDFGEDIMLPEDPIWFSTILDKRPNTYYYSVSDREAQLPKWVDFRTGCAQKLLDLQSKIASLALIQPPPKPKNPNPNIKVIPSYINYKFKAKLLALNKEFDEFENRATNSSTDVSSRVVEKINQAILDLASASKEKACKIIHQLEADLFELQTEFENNDHIYVKQASVYLKELIYVSKYAADNEKDYLKDQLMYQLEFLTYVMGLDLATAPFDLNYSSYNAHLMWDGVVDVCPRKTPERTPIPTELPDYDLISCNDKSTFGHKDIIHFTLECNVMTTEISDKYSPISFKYKENWVKNQMIEVSGGVNIKAGGIGVSVGGGMDDKGNKSGSVGVGGKVGGVAVGGTAGVNVDGNGNVTGTAGVSATVGIVSIGGKATIDKNGNVSSQAQVGIKAGNVNAQGNINSNLDVTGNVKVSGGSNIISNVTGPLQTSASSNVEVIIELDRNGISDIQTTGGVKGSANISGGDSNNVIGTQIGANTGASGTYVWNAGGNPSASGTLSGLNFGGK
jgi:hypothetical protein